MANSPLWPTGERDQMVAHGGRLMACFTEAGVLGRIAEINDGGYFFFDRNNKIKKFSKYYRSKSIFSDIKSVYFAEYFIESPFELKHVSWVAKPLTNFAGLHGMYHRNQLTQLTRETRLIHQQVV